MQKIVSDIQADGNFSIIGQIISNFSAAAPFVVASSLLVTGLNADLLDGKHASSFAPIERTISAGVGLTGGGPLSSNISIGVNFGTLAGTVAQGNDSRILNGQTAFNWGSHVGKYIGNSTTVGSATPLMGPVDADLVSYSSVVLSGAYSNTPQASGFLSTHISASSGNAVQVFHGSGENDAYFWRRRVAGISYQWTRAATQNWVIFQNYLTGINSGMVTGALGYTPYNSSNPANYISASSVDTLTNKSGNVSMFNNDAGYLTSVNYAGVISALGYTPYNSTNPNNFTSNSGTVYQVGLNAPAGMEVTTSPVTTTGNHNLQWLAGFSPVTTAQIAAWNTSLSRWISSPVNYANVNDIFNSGVEAWGDTALNRPYAWGTTFTFAGGSATGNAGPGIWVNQILAGTDGNWFMRYGGGNSVANGGPVWQTMYQFITTKQATLANIASWNAAVTWGNHASAGYALNSALASYVPTARSLTINGVTHDLSANRTWTFPVGTGTVKSVSITLPTGLTSSVSTITDTGTFPISFSSGYSIPTTVKQEQWDQARLRWANTAIYGTTIDTTPQNGVSSWGENALDRPNSRLYGSKFTFIGNSANGLSGSWASHLLAATTGDWYVQVGTSGPKYEVWTSKEIPYTTLTNGNAAFGWGNHAGAGYITGINSGMVTGALGFAPTPTTRAITINGVTQDLSTNRTWTISAGSGTVTQVGLLVPTQFEVLSSPINAANPSNNLQFGVKSGYVIPTNAQTSSWDAKLSGSGTSGYIPMWSGANSFTNSSIRQVTQDWGQEILFDNTRSYGYEGDTAFRATVNMHTDVAIGKNSYHGRLCIHNQTTASFSPSAAFQIESTTRGFLFSRMTRAQRLAIVSPPALGLHVYQTDSVGDSWRGLKVWDGNQWGHYTVDFIHA